MTFQLNTPITGSAQTGLTSPSFSIVEDRAVSAYAKQYAVSSATGAAGLTPASVSSPFTISMARPSVYRGLAPVNPATGQLRNVPMNVHRLITRKGVIPLAGQSPVVMNITTSISVPAGADVADPANVRAALAAHIGALSQNSAGIGDVLVLGVL